MVISAGRGCTLIKKDIKYAFRNIPVAPANKWLLGFMWKDIYYTECCLPFGLASDPFLFNLFAEAFHWILQSYLDIQFIFHYLDDFIFALPELQVTSATLQNFTARCNSVTDTLGIPRADAKDAIGTCITVLGIEIDTVLMTARRPIDKLERAILMTSIALAHTSIFFELAAKRWIGNRPTGINTVYKAACRIVRAIDFYLLLYYTHNCNSGYEHRSRTLRIDPQLI